MAVRKTLSDYDKRIAEMQNEIAKMRKEKQKEQERLYSEIGKTYFKLLTKNNNELTEEDLLSTLKKGEILQPQVLENSSSPTDSETEKSY